MCIAANSVMHIYIGISFRHLTSICAYSSLLTVDIVICRLHIYVKNIFIQVYLFSLLGLLSLYIFLVSHQHVCFIAGQLNLNVWSKELAILLCYVILHTVK